MLPADNGSSLEAGLEQVLQRLQHLESRHTERDATSVAINAAPREDETRSEEMSVAETSPLNDVVEATQSASTLHGAIAQMQALMDSKQTNLQQFDLDLTPEVAKG